MVLHLSRLFSAATGPSPQLPQQSLTSTLLNVPTDEAEIDARSEAQLAGRFDTQTYDTSPSGAFREDVSTPRASVTEPSSAMSAPALASSTNAEAVPQFTVLTISNLLAQNSNLLAQNLEMSRRVERLREGDMERIKRELKEEVRAEVFDELRAEMQDALTKAVEGIARTLVELQPTPRPTPPGVPASLVQQSEPDLVNCGELEPRDIDSDQDQDQDVGLGAVPGRMAPDSWALDQHPSSQGIGKAKEVDQSQGVDPNELRVGKKSFMSMDASSETGGVLEQEMEDMAMAGPSSITELTSENQLNTMNVPQLSAIAQQVLAMENNIAQADEILAVVPEPPGQRPASARRALRVPASQPNYHSHPIDDVLRRGGSGRASTSQGTPSGSQSKPKTPKSKGKGKAGAEAKSGSDKKRKTSVGGTDEKPRRKRIYNGRASMNARALAASTGLVRGQGVWPPKGENTVKGNMQEIACDNCHGRVHWACAGFEDETVAPDEWECPDCIVRTAQGVHSGLIEKYSQDKCMRPTCIRRARKKIMVKEGDEEEFYVEKYIGRRAIGRRQDGTTRVFEYLVKWLGYPTVESTWEHENKFPDHHYADDFLRDCRNYDVNTKKRVAMLPETRRWFDAEGGFIASEDEDDEDEEDGYDGTPTPAVPDHDGEMDRLRASGGTIAEEERSDHDKTDENVGLGVR